VQEAVEALGVVELFLEVLAVVELVITVLETLALQIRVEAQVVAKELQEQILELAVRVL
jgi:hypothetical protein